ncbi:MAG: tetratricopeptide repeat protein [Bullifex sp.]
MAKKRNDGFARKLREGYECLLAGLGGDHIVTFILKDMLCDELLNNDDFEGLYELSAGMADEALDPENEMTDSTRINACTNHILACLETGRYAEAIREGERILPIIRKKYNTEPLRRAEYVYNLADAYLSEKQPVKAEALLKRELSALDKAEIPIADPVYVAMSFGWAGALNGMGKHVLARNVLNDLADAFSKARRNSLSDMATMDSPDDETGFQFMASGMMKILCEKALEKVGTGEIFTLNSLASAPGFREQMFDAIRTIGDTDEEFLSSLIKDIPSLRNR